MNPPDMDRRLITLYLWRIQLEDLLKKKLDTPLPEDVKIVDITAPDPNDYITALKVTLRSAEFMPVPEDCEPPIAHLVYGELFLPMPPQKKASEWVEIPSESSPGMKVYARKTTTGATTKYYTDVHWISFENDARSILEKK